MSVIRWFKVDRCTNGLICFFYFILIGEMLTQTNCMPYADGFLDETKLQILIEICCEKNQKSNRLEFFIGTVNVTNESLVYGV